MFIECHFLAPFRTGEVDFVGFKVHFKHDIGQVSHDIGQVKISLFSFMRSTPGLSCLVLGGVMQDGVWWCMVIQGDT